MTSPLACICCHFNFAQFSRPRQNLFRFVRQMRSFEIPCYGAELYLRDQAPFTTNWENWRQFSCGSEGVIFQKEALLNLVAFDLPKEVKFVAWIDADVMFTNLKWAAQTVEALEHFKAVQLFTRCIFTDKEGRPSFAWQGTGATGKMDLTKAHPGFGWAARREFWDVGGLYPYAVTGAGDVMIAAALQGCGLPKSFEESLGADRGGNTFLKWNTAVHGWSRNEVGYLGGDLIHEYHGSHKDRAYVERKDALKGFIAGRDVRMRPDGVLQWTQNAPAALREYVEAMFRDRKEDA